MAINAEYNYNRILDYIKKQAKKIKQSDEYKNASRRDRKKADEYIASLYGEVAERQKNLSDFYLANDEAYITEQETERLRRERRERRGTGIGDIENYLGDFARSAGEHVVNDPATLYALLAQTVGAKEHAKNVMQGVADRSENMEAAFGRQAEWSTNGSWKPDSLADALDAGIGTTIDMATLIYGSPLNAGANMIGGSAAKAGGAAAKDWLLKNTGSKVLSSLGGQAVNALPTAVGMSLPELYRDQIDYDEHGNVKLPDSVLSTYVLSIPHAMIEHMGVDPSKPWTPSLRKSFRKAVSDWWGGGKGLLKRGFEEGTEELLQDGIGMLDKRMSSNTRDDGSPNTIGTALQDWAGDLYRNYPQLLQSFALGGFGGALMFEDIGNIKSNKELTAQRANIEKQKADILSLADSSGLTKTEEDRANLLANIDKAIEGYDIKIAGNDTSIAEKQKLAAEKETDRQQKESIINKQQVDLLQNYVTNMDSYNLANNKDKGGFFSNTFTDSNDYNYAQLKDLLALLHQQQQQAEQQEQQSNEEAKQEVEQKQQQQQSEEKPTLSKEEQYLKEYNSLGEEEQAQYQDVNEYIAEKLDNENNNTVEQQKEQVKTEKKKATTYLESLKNDLAEQEQALNKAVKNNDVKAVKQIRKNIKSIEQQIKDSEKATASLNKALAEIKQGKKQNITALRDRLQAVINKKNNVKPQTQQTKEESIAQALGEDYSDEYKEYQDSLNYLEENEDVGQDEDINPDEIGWKFEAEENDNDYESIPQQLSKEDFILQALGIKKNIKQNPNINTAKAEKPVNTSTGKQDNGRMSFAGREQEVKANNGRPNISNISTEMSSSEKPNSSNVSEKPTGSTNEESSTAQNKSVLDELRENKKYKADIDYPRGLKFDNGQQAVLGTNITEEKGSGYRVQINKVTNAGGIPINGSSIVYSNNTGYVRAVADVIKNHDPIKILFTKDFDDAVEKRQAEILNEDKAKFYAKQSNKPEEPTTKKIKIKVVKKQQKQNRIFTDDEFQKRMARLKSAANRIGVNPFADPQIVEDALYCSCYFLESGARKFADYCKKMVEALGENAEKFKDYLAGFYMMAKKDPRLKALNIDKKEFSTEDEVDSFDLDNLFNKDFNVSDEQIDSAAKELEGSISHNEINELNDMLQKGTTETEPNSQRQENGKEVTEKANEQQKQEAVETDDSPIVTDVNNVDYNNAVDRLLKRIGELLEGKKNNNWLGNTIFGNVKELTVRHGKLMQELFEGALAKYVRDNNPSLEDLLKIYNNQPTLNQRTVSQKEYQAFSTPVVLANALTNIFDVKDNAIVFEPTAGNGLLVSGVNPNADFKLNELQSERNSILKAVFGVDVTNSNALVMDMPSADFVITNPPFGVNSSMPKATVQMPKLMSTGSVNYVLSDQAHIIAIKALKAMKTTGKAIIIYGAPGGYFAKNEKGFRSGSAAIFERMLFNYFNVPGIFEIDGKLYGKQGASFPIVCVVVDGKRNTAHNIFQTKDLKVNRLNSWEEVFKECEAIKQRIADEIDVLGNKFTLSNGTVKELQEQLNNKKRESGNIQQNPVEKQSKKVEKELKQQAKEVQEKQENTSPEKINEQIAEGEKNTEPVNNVEAVKEVVGDGKLQTKYNPVSTNYSIGSLVPTNLAKPIDLALKMIQNAYGKLTDFVGKMTGLNANKVFSGEQIDALALYGDKLLNKSAMVCADQTGLGKGRVAAGAIVMSKKAGHIPLFFTETDRLFSDIYRDMRNIGAKDLRPFFINKDGFMTYEDEKGNTVTAYNKISDGERNKVLKHILDGDFSDFTGENAKYDYIVGTYSQFQNNNRSSNTKDAAINKLIKSNDCDLIMDEAHNAAAKIELDNPFVKKKKDEEGNTIVEASRTYNRFLEFTKNANSILFLSATWAKTKENMAIYSRAIGMSVEQINRNVNQGGQGMMELLIANMARMGKYIRREQDFAGVKYTNEIITTDEDEVREEVRNSDDYNRLIKSAIQLSQAISKLIKDKNFIEPYIREQLGEDFVGSIGEDDKELSDTKTSPFSVVHNFVNSILLSLKADKVANEAIRQIKAGLKPVIALEKTAETHLVNFANSKQLKYGDETTPFSVSDIFEGISIGQLYNIPIKSATGEKGLKITIPYEALPDDMKAAFKTIKESLKQTNLSNLTGSPIDRIKYLIKKAGYSVDEITGRSSITDYVDDSKVVYKRRENASSGLEKRKIINRFNSGKLDCIILNESGSTGISLHASKEFADKKQRIMLIAQPFGDINTMMQMLGRIHRVGQIKLPIYKYVMTSLLQENRVANNLQDKLKSLNANTSSNKEGQQNFSKVDVNNVYGLEAMRKWVLENIETAIDLELADVNEEGNITVRNYDAKQITGRLAIAPQNIQREFWEYVTDKTESLINEANINGTNQLVVPSYDKADSIVVDSRKVAGKNVAEDFYIKTIDMSVVGNPTSIANAISRAEKGYSISQDNEAMDKLKEDCRLFISSKTEELRNKNTRNQSNIINRAKNRISSNYALLQKLNAGMQLINADGDVGIVTDVKVKNTKEPSKSNPLIDSKIVITLASPNAVGKMIINAEQYGEKRWEIVDKNDVIADRNFNERWEELYKENSTHRENAQVITGNLFNAIDYARENGLKVSQVQFRSKDGKGKMQFVYFNRNGRNSSINVPSERLTNVTDEDFKKTKVYVSDLGNGVSSRMFLDYSGAVDLYFYNVGKKSPIFDYLRELEDNIFGKDSFNVTGKTFSITLSRFEAKDSINAFIKDMATKGIYYTEPMTESAKAERSRKAQSEMPQEFEEDDVHFSISSNRVNKAIGTNKLNSVINRIGKAVKEKLNLGVVACKDSAELLKKLRTDGANIKAIPTGAEGCVFNGKVYLVADNIQDGNRVFEVLAHEIAGHVGAEKIYPHFNSLMKELLKLENSDNAVKAIFDDVRKNYHIKDDEIRIASEVFAKVMERVYKNEQTFTGKVKNLVNYFVKMVKDFFRKTFGANIQFSQNDLYAIATKILHRTTFNSLMQGEVVRKGYDESTAFEDEPVFAKVENKALLDRLNSEPTIKAYRAMQLIDGKLYPPMAAYVDGKLVEPTELNTWYMADEHPELLLVKVGEEKYIPIEKYLKENNNVMPDDSKLFFKLGKGKDDSGKSGFIKARYNPYWHASLSPLNDQFKAAWNRSNMVTVEVEIPVSELTSGYMAKYAKDPVGETEWKSGSVSGQLAKLGKPRKVILSRYNKVVRIIPNDELAGVIAKQLKGTGIKIPVNTVTPQLKNELEKLGVEFAPPEKGAPKQETKKDPSKITSNDVVNLLERAKNGELKDKTYIPVRPNTPSILIQKAKEKLGLDVPNLPVIMSVEKARQAMEEESSDDNKDKSHGLSPDDLSSMINKLDNPDYIFYQNNGRFTELVKITGGNGKKHLVIIDYENSRDTEYLNGYKGGYFNVIITAFEPEKNYLKGYLKNSKIIYDKSKRAPQSDSSSSDMLSYLNGALSKKIISENEDNRNNQPQFSIPTDQYEFDAYLEREWQKQDKRINEKNVVQLSDEETYNKGIAEGKRQAEQDRKKAIESIKTAAKIARLAKNREKGLQYLEQQKKINEAIENARKPKKTTVAQKLQSVENWLAMNLADRKHKLELFQKDIEKAIGHTLEDYKNPFRQLDTIDGRIQHKTESFNDKHFKPLYDFLIKNGITYDDFNLFTYAMHADERDKYINEINPTFKEKGIRGSGWNNEKLGTVEDVKKKLFAKYGEDKLMKAGKMFWNMNRAVIDLQEQYGLIDNKTAKNIRERYQYYTPLKHIDDDEITTKVVERALGRTSTAQDNLMFATAAIDTTIRWGEKNNAKLAMLNLAHLYKSPMVEVNRQKLEPFFNSKTGKVEYRFDKKLPDNTITAIANGIRYNITFNDEDLYKAFVNDSRKPEWVESLIKGSRMVTNLVGFVSTMANPDFGIANFVRDQEQSGMENTVYRGGKFAGNAFKYALPSIKTYIDYRRGIDNEYTRMYKEFLENGGLTGYADMLRLDKRAVNLEKSINEDIEAEKGALGKLKKLAKNPSDAIHSIFGIFEAFNDSLESATRFGVYKEKRKTSTALEAAELAKNITINFNRHGTLWSSDMNALYLFSNASIQGTRKAWQMLKAASKTNKGRAIVGSVVAAGFISEILGNMFAGFDPDDDKSYYDKLEEWKKDGNIIIFTGGKKYTSIPLSPMIAFPYMIGRNTAAYMFGKKNITTAISDIFANFLTTLNPLGEDSKPLGSVIPTSFRPLVDLWTNRKWSGAKIRPEQSDNGAKKPRHKLYFDNKTNKALVAFTKWISDLTGGDEYKGGSVDLNPANMQYLFESVSGGLGKSLYKGYKLATGQAEGLDDIPMLRRFYGETNEYSTSNEYRENSEISDRFTKAKSNRDFEFLKKNRNLIKIHNIIKVADKQIDRIRDRKNISEAEKELAVTKIQKKANVAIRKLQLQ